MFYLFLRPTGLYKSRTGGRMCGCKSGCKCQSLSGLVNAPTGVSVYTTDVPYYMQGGYKIFVEADPSALDPNFKWSDSEYKADGSPLLKGVYGDEPVYLYNDRDDNDQNRSEWRAKNGGNYVPNSKEYWQETNTSRESLLWA